MVFRHYYYYYYYYYYFYYYYYHYYYYYYNYYYYYYYCVPACLRSWLANRRHEDARGALLARGAAAVNGPPPSSVTLIRMTATATADGWAGKKLKNSRPVGAKNTGTLKLGYGRSGWAFARGSPQHFVATLSTKTALQVLILVYVCAQRHTHPQQGNWHYSKRPSTSATCF